MPLVPKLSAGYYARPGMDLIDLFIGSEGTLGIVTAVTLRQPRRGPPSAPRWCHSPRKKRRWPCGEPARRRARDMADWQPPHHRRIGHRAHGCPIAGHPPRGPGVDAMNNVRLPPGSRSRAARGAGTCGGHRRSGSIRPDRPCSRRSPSGYAARQVLRDAVRCRSVRRRRDRSARRFRPARPTCRASGGRSGGSQPARRLAKSSVDAAIDKTAADVACSFDHLGSCSPRSAPTRRAVVSMSVGPCLGRQPASERHPTDARRGGRRASLSKRPAGWRFASAGRRWRSTASAATPSSSACCASVRAAGIDQMRAVKGAVDPEWKLAPGVCFRPRSAELRSAVAVPNGPGATRAPPARSPPAR